MKLSDITEHVPVDGYIYLIEVVVAFFVIRFVAQMFAEEKRNIPRFKVEGIVVSVVIQLTNIQVPKKQGGAFKPEVSERFYSI